MEALNVVEEEMKDPEVEEQEEKDEAIVADVEITDDEDEEKEEAIVTDVEITDDEEEEKEEAIVADEEDEMEEEVEQETPEQIEGTVTIPKLQNKVM